MAISKLYPETPEVSFEVKDFVAKNELSKLTLQKNGQIRLVHQEKGFMSGFKTDQDLTLNANETFSQGTKASALQFLATIEKHNRENQREVGNQLLGPKQAAINYIRDVLNQSYSDPKTDITCRTRPGTLPSGASAPKGASDCTPGGQTNPKINELFDFAILNGSALNLAKLTEIRDRLRAANNDAYPDQYDTDDIEKAFVPYERDFSSILAEKKKEMQSGLAAKLKVVSEALADAQKALGEVETIKNNLQDLTANYEKTMKTKEKNGGFMQRITTADAARQRVLSEVQTLSERAKRFRLQNDPELVQGFSQVKVATSNVEGAVKAATAASQVTDTRIKDVEFEYFKKTQREKAGKEIPQNLGIVEQSIKDLGRVKAELEKIKSSFDYKNTSYDKSLQIGRFVRDQADLATASSAKSEKAKSESDGWIDEMKRLELPFDDLTQNHEKITTRIQEARTLSGAVQALERGISATVATVARIHEGKQNIARSRQVAEEGSRTARSHADNARREATRQVSRTVSQASVNELRQLSDNAARYAAQAQATAAQVEGALQTARGAADLLSSLGVLDEDNRRKVHEITSLASDTRSYAAEADQQAGVARGRHAEYSRILGIIGAVRENESLARGHADSADSEMRAARDEAGRFITAEISQRNVDLLREFRDEARQHADNASIDADRAESAARQARATYNQLGYSDPALYLSITAADASAREARSDADDALAYHRQASTRYETLREQLRNLPPPPPSGTPGGGNPDEGWEKPTPPPPGGGNPDDGW